MSVNAPPFQRAQRLGNITLSEIVQVSERVVRLRGEGRDIVTFGTGEPDFPTPEHVIEAAHAAALAGKTRYTPTPGIPELRAAIAAIGGAQASEVIVSTGAKQVIANAMLASLNSGDEVIMPAPFWISYADIVRLAAGTPVILPCPLEQGFKLTPGQLEAAITPRTRWLILNSPSNPTGAIYTREEIVALASVLEAHPQVWVLADEIYQHINYVPFVSFADAAPELRGRLLIVNGVAKTWSMTGWRIGWGIGPVDLIKEMATVQGQLTSGAGSVAQWASLAAIQGDPAIIEHRRRAFTARCAQVVAGLNAIPGIDCPAPDGAFYVFPSCQGVLAAAGRFAGDAELCAWLLEHAGVAVVPGRAFGLEGHFRLSFAYAEDTINEGIARMARAFREAMA